MHLLQTTVQNKLGSNLLVKQFKIIHFYHLFILIQYFS